MRTSPDSDDSFSGPPWFVRGPNGRINPLAIPNRLQEHPEIQRRGLVIKNAEKPGVVYSTFDANRPRFVVKILDLDTEERAIYEQLLRDSDRANHTVPGELTQRSYPLLIMPRLSSYHYLCPQEFSSSETLGMFAQLIGGVEFLHRQNIAHMDLCYGNILVATRYDAEDHANLVPNRLYIIDFDSARRFEDGPGVQRAITLPPAQTPPPDGIGHFDPYSWDVYCAGRTLEAMMQFHGEKALPWLTRWYVRWLVGEERGCTGVCRCRPTARRARMVLSALRSTLYVLQLGVVPSLFASRVLSRRIFPRS